MTVAVQELTLSPFSQSFRNDCCKEISNIHSLCGSPIQIAGDRIGTLTFDFDHHLEFLPQTLRCVPAKEPVPQRVRQPSNPLHVHFHWTRFNDCWKEGKVSGKTTIKAPFFMTLPRSISENPRVAFGYAVAPCRAVRESRGGGVLLPGAAAARRGQRAPGGAAACGALGLGHGWVGAVGAVGGWVGSWVGGWLVGWLVGELGVVGWVVGWLVGWVMG